MKTLLKSLALATLLATGATAIAPAANAYEVVRERTVVVRHDGEYRNHRRWHRGYNGRHCRSRVWYHHGVRHVQRTCW